MTTRSVWKLLLASSCFVWVWGCTIKPQPDHQPTPSPTFIQTITDPASSQTPAFTPSSESNMPTRPIPPTPADPEPAIVQRSAEAASCQKDLARRLGKPETAIQFWREFSDEFPADHLGCIGPKTTPRPIPAIVSGTVIQFKVGEKIYSYHIHGVQIEFCGPWD